jgi:hypothetical protein
MYTGMLAAVHGEKCLAESKDAHDKLVYARYDLKVAPGKIAYVRGAGAFGGDDLLKHTELTRPATKEDVAGGKAVFTLEGLGKRHVWKLPECPISASWVGLREFPSEWTDGTTRYQNSGRVVQAEELLVDGKWKRYFGFVCEHGVAVVPANAVDLWLPSKLMPPGTSSGAHLPGGIGWQVSPLYQVHDGKRISTNFAGGQSVFVDVYLINRRGAPMKMPTDLYRDADGGGPALVKGLTLSVGFAPFKARTAKIYYPELDDYTSLKPKRRETFAPTTSARTLNTGKWFKAFTIDLSDWFDIKNAGHYSFGFEFDVKAMGLPKQPGWSWGTFLQVFDIGTPPKRLTAKEMNETIPPFGGRVTEKQLRELIVKTIKPPASAPSPKSNTTNLLLPATELPAFSRTPRFGGSAPLVQAAIVGIYNANRSQIATLSYYEPVGLLKELERRLTAEKDPDMKLLIASQAASRGSRSAALFLLDSMKSTDNDCEAVSSTHIALRQTLYGLGADHPDWIVQLVISALADRRYVTNVDHSSSDLLTISDHADEVLTLALGYVKCRKAVPFLIQMCKDTKGAREPVIALGLIGDQRAVAVLMECLRRAGKTVEYDGRFGLADRFIRPVNALASLKAREAVPELLKHVASPDVIEALATLGDARAIRPLEKLVADAGRIVKDGKSVAPGLAAPRVIAAKITLACLDKKDSVAKLCGLLSDKSFGEFQRRAVVWRLGDRQDPRAIPFLIEAIKNDSSGAVVNQAITVLSVFKYKATVEGLVDCFDVDFKGKADWKRAYKPEMFRENIAGSLREITGHELGPDQQAWLDWWRKNRETTKVVN